MGSGIDGVVETMTAGASLLVGGQFQAAGGRLAANVALWDDDFAVPVLAASLAAVRDGHVARLTWEAADLSHAGFHVYRAAVGGERVRLTTSLLTGGPGFSWIDASPPDDAADYWLLEVSRAGTEAWHGPATLLPRAPRLRLERISGNPSRGPVTFGYAVPGAGDVSLRLFDVRGRLVRTLLAQPVPTGRSEISWDGRDDAGAPAPAGTYFLRLQTPFGELSEKIQRIP
jgi:hypothetical protein